MEQTPVTILEAVSMTLGTTPVYAVLDLKEVTVLTTLMTAFLNHVHTQAAALMGWPATNVPGLHSTTNNLLQVVVSPL